MLSQNWKHTLHTPHMYRVGNSTLYFQNKFLIGIILLLIILTFIYFYPTITTDFCKSSIKEKACRQPLYDYNNIYPLSTPVKTNTGISYKIAIISDLDHSSKSSSEKNVWNSFLMKGVLHWMPSHNVITIKWQEDKTVTLSSSLSHKGRGMELSELVVFDGRLLAVEDRTGLVYFIEDDIAYPWIILNDGNGKSTKGFKSEWATVKDNYLYIGSMGKEWTTENGELIHNNPMWVKVVSPTGEIRSLDWTSNYKRLREKLDIKFPGYMIHESGMWSDVHKLWFFLPRRCSKEQYNENTDEEASCNVLLKTDEYFSKVEAIDIGNLIKIRGFSSFKFLPGSQDTIIVALKSEEFQGNTATYITAFTIDGHVLMPDLKVIDKKFEGLEFI